MRHFLIRLDDVMTKHIADLLATDRADHPEKYAEEDGSLTYLPDCFASLLVDPGIEEDTLNDMCL